MKKYRDAAIEAEQKFGINSVEHLIALSNKAKFIDMTTIHQLKPITIQDEDGNNVTCVDIDLNKVLSLREGIIPIYPIFLDSPLGSQITKIFADLDGNLLISNDLFRGMQVVKGKITLTNLPGIGIEKI
jgi:hypothetical protein